jgi:hypothetical protein
MPVVVGLSSITGVSTATSGSDAAYKEYVDNRPSGTFASGNENEFLFTNGNTVSWEPIGATQEYATAGSYTFNLPTQAKKITIEATGAGGGGASGDAMATEYVPGSLWSLRTVGTTTQLNALAFRNNSYLLGGAALETFWTLRTSGTVSNIFTSLYVSPNYYVAGASGILRVSTDTIHWVARTSGTTAQIGGGSFSTGGYGLIYNGTDLYLYGGSGGVIATSTDSIAWTLRTSSIGANNVGSIAYASDKTEKYVVCGASQAIASSTNAIQWTLRTAGFAFAQYASMLYVNGSYSILSTNTQPPIFINSTDGIIWTQSATFPTAQTSYSAGFTYGNGLYVVSPSSQPAQILVSTNTIVWTLRTSGTTANIFALSYDSGTNLYVASGSSGYTSVSTDTIVWQARVSGFSANSIFTLTLGNNVFLNGGGSGNISTTTPNRLFGTGAYFSTSTNTLHWFLRTTSTIQSINSIGTSNDYIVAGCTNGFNIAGIISVTTDGINWVLRTSGFGNATINSIVYGDVYVAGGNLGTPNVQWTLRTAGFGANAIGSLLFANNTYIAGGANGILNVSTDSINWTLRTSNLGANSFGRLTFGNGIYATVSGAILSTSTDTITWVLRTSGVAGMNSIAFGNNTYVLSASTGSARVFSSTDAIHWTERSINMNTNGATGATFVNNIFLVGGPGGNMRRSTDGITWETIASPLGGVLSLFAYGNGLYIAGTTQLAVSTDAVTWTLRNYGYSTSLGFTAFDFGGGIFSITSSDFGALRYFVSTDTLIWTARTVSTLFTTAIYSIEFGNNIYVAGGESGRLITATPSSLGDLVLDGVLQTSTDTITWTFRTTSDTLNQINGLVYTTTPSSNYVSVRNGGAIQTSTNAIIWTGRVQSTTSNLNAIVYGNSLYVAAGASGVITTSTDSTTWVLRTSGTGTTIRGLSFSGSTYVANGDSGLILSSTDTIIWISRTANTTANLLGDVGVGNTFITAGTSGALSASPVRLGSGGPGGGGGATVTWELDRSQITGSTLSVIVGSGGTSNTSGAGTTVSWDGPAGTYAITANGGSRGTAYNPGAGGTVPNSNFNYSRATAGLAGGTGLVPGSTPTTATAATLAYQTTGGGAGSHSIDYNKFGGILGGSGGTINYYNNTVTNASIESTGRNAPGVPGLSYGGGGSGGGAASGNAIFWTSRTASIPNSTSDIFYGNNLYIVDGGDISSILNTSTDAIHWTLRTIGSTYVTLNSIIYGSDAYVAAGQVILTTSTNAIVWTQRNAGNGGVTINALAFGNNTYVAGCAGGVLSTSTDAITWTLRTSGFGSNAINKNTFIFGNNIFVAGGASGVLNTSTDAISWTLRTAGFGSNAISALTYGNGIYVATGGTGVINTSTDAISWTLRTSGTASGLNALTFGNNTYVGVSGSTLFISTDSITWSSIGSGVSVSYSLAYGNNLYLLAGAGGTIRTSPIISAGSGGAGVKGGGGGGGGYEETTNIAGAGGRGGDGYVRISWV